MTAICSVGYVGLGVADLRAWEAFATGVLGLQSWGLDEAGVLRLRMDEQLYRLALHEDRADDLLYVGLEVADADRLDQVEAALSRIGVTSRRGDATLAAARAVMGLTQFEGPDGIGYEAFYGPTLRPGEPFNSPRGCRFVTGSQGVGHMVLHTDDLAASLRFFQEGLGFRLSDVIERVRDGRAVPIYFLHCNRRHHTIALAAADGAPKRLNHVMLQVSAIDDLGRAMDEAARTQTPLIRALGRHVNDGMISFYMRSPSGFGVEYGWGAIEIEEAWTVRRFDRGSVWGHSGL